MTPSLDLEALDPVKQRQQATWASSGYSVIGTSLQIVGESLCEAIDVRAGWQVLDGAAGNGNAALAARRGCDVTAADHVGGFLDGAKRRAETFKTHYGPTVRAWDALDTDGQQSLRDELIALADNAKRDTTGALTVPSADLDVVVSRGE